MASIAIHSAGKFPSFIPTNKPGAIPLAPKKFPPHSPSASSHHKIIHQSMELASDSRSKREYLRGRIDSWLRHSVADIVKNLKHAPLLVQIYSEFDGGVKVRTEKAVLDEWAVVRDEWTSGESKSPDGLIFVEELEKESSDGEGARQAWGIVVQGKGAECGPSCYLLKTDRVCAGLGLGFCTHFCLMRVNNFRDSAFDQFQDSWLLQ